MDYRLALVDTDTIAYRCAASCEPSKKRALELNVPFESLEVDPLDIAIQRADELCYRILSETQTEKYRFFLSGSGNFRKSIYPLYKANRERLQRPTWLDPVREFLATEWKAEICAGYEADDGIAIALDDSSIVCANDKDFRQLAGYHYNFVKSEFFTVDPLEAEVAFWSSMLIGDSSDNVRGVDGLGPIKTHRLLAGLNPEEMEHRVRGLYADEGRFALNYRLLRLVRSKEELEKVLNEAAECESKGTEPTKACSDQGFDPFQTINS